MEKCIVCEKEIPTAPCAFDIHNTCDQPLCSNEQCKFEHMANHILSPFAEYDMKKHSERMFWDLVEESPLSAIVKKNILASMIMKLDAEEIHPNCIQTLGMRLARTSYLREMRSQMKTIIMTPLVPGKHLAVSDMFFKLTNSGMLIAGTRDTDCFKEWPDRLTYKDKSYEWAGRHVPLSNPENCNYGEYVLAED